MLKVLTLSYLFLSFFLSLFFFFSCFPLTLFFKLDNFYQSVFKLTLLSPICFFDHLLNFLLQILNFLVLVFQFVYFMVPVSLLRFPVSLLISNIFFFTFLNIGIIVAIPANSNNGAFQI